MEEGGSLRLVGTFLCRSRELCGEDLVIDDIVPLVVVLGEVALILFAFVGYELTGALENAAVIGFCPFFLNDVLIPVLTRDDSQSRIDGVVRAVLLGTAVHIGNYICGIEACSVDASVLVAHSGIKVPRSFKTELFAALCAEVGVNIEA